WQVSGFIHTVQGNYEAVRSEYAKALALYEQAGDEVLQAKILDNRARLEFMEGHAETAIADESRAADLAAKNREVRRQAFVEEELGVIYSTLGDFEASYQAYGQALK